jgi:RimJ/RimL family protein N-acetyltransferase
VLERPLHTERLTLRPPTAGDAHANRKFRQVESVNEWLTGCPADLDGYRECFSEPARLATTVIVTLGHDPAAPITGGFMLRREDDRARLGWVLDPAHSDHRYATEALRELLRYCFQDLGVQRITANCFLDHDTSWRLVERASACAANCMRSASHCTGRADGWTRSATPSSKRSGRRPEQPGLVELPGIEPGSLSRWADLLRPFPAARLTHPHRRVG